MPLRSTSGLGCRRGNGPVAGAATIGVIALGRAGSFALENSRMDALAMTALAHFDGSLGTLHNHQVPFFFVAPPSQDRPALYFELRPAVAPNFDPAIFQLE